MEPDELIWPEAAREIPTLLRRTTATGRDQILECLIRLPAQGYRRSWPFKVVRVERFHGGGLVGEALFTLTGEFAAMSYEDRWFQPLKRACAALLKSYGIDIHNPRVELPGGVCEFACIDGYGRYWVREGVKAEWTLVKHPTIVPPGELLGPGFKRVKPDTKSIPCQS